MWALVCFGFVGYVRSIEAKYPGQRDCLCPLFLEEDVPSVQCVIAEYFRLHLIRDLSKA
jgi:hypothetical protein